MTSTRQRTVAVHGDNHHGTAGGPVTPPIVQSSTFTLPLDAVRGPLTENQLLYTRVRNPNFEQVEEVVARLEGARGGVLFGSGMAAIAAAIEAMTRHGDHIVVMDDCYGTTRHLFDQLAERGERRITYLDLSNRELLAEALPPLAPRLVWVESVSNPLLKVVDLALLDELRQRHGFQVVVDNTFATPIGCRPLDYGADAVVHSATKYLDGHSDVVAGLVVANEPALLEAIELQRRFRGGISDPFAAWLLRRGLQTLAVRMAAHEFNATALARHLEADSLVEQVLYPRLASHPNHEVAGRMLVNFGGMITVRLNTDAAGVYRFLAALEIARLAVSLGGVETLVNHPYSMTHGHLNPADLARLGIDERLLRISVGIEDKDDLIRDFGQALEAI